MKTKVAKNFFWITVGQISLAIHLGFLLCFWLTYTRNFLAYLPGIIITLIVMLLAFKQKNFIMHTIPRIYERYKRKLKVMYWYWLLNITLFISLWITLFSGAQLFMDDKQICHRVIFGHNYHNGWVLVFIVITVVTVFLMWMLYREMIEFADEK